MDGYKNVEIAKENETDGREKGEEIMFQSRLRNRNKASRKKEI